MLNRNEDQETPLEQQIEWSHQRLAELQQRTHHSTDSGLHIEALAELSVALEELSVTTEELHQQNEELLNTRQALEIEHERYQTLFQLAPDGYLVTDQRAVIQEANQLAAQLLNVSSQFLQGKPFDLFVAEVDRARFLTSLEQFSGSQRLHHHWQMNLQPREQISFPASISVAATRDFSGQVTNLRWLLRDLSDLERAEQTIHSQAALLDITSDAILVQDLDNQILYWNRGAERLYGWTAEEALGQDPQAFLYGDTLPTFAAIQTTLAEQGVWRGELSQITRSGQPLVVESHWTLMPEQTPASILIVNTDITEKKQLELQFQRAQRLESIGTLASGIAHDLNNILTPILAIAQLLPHKLSITDQQILRMFEILKTNAQRGANLVHQVLLFSRGTEEQLKSVSVSSILSDLEKMVAETFPKSFELHTTISPDLWSVRAEATRLHQVFLNLYINARDAMPNGGRLCVSAENVAMDDIYAQMYPDAQVGPYVVITLADTGVGIPSEQLEHIFDPFFTTKEPGQGTGLGLSTAIGIINNYGGFIDVTSTVNKGTQFKIFLPSVERSAPLTSALMTPRSGNGELILVVDDEEAIREISKATLKTFNYQVLTAEDGIEALALYAQYRSVIKVVLLDMMMPSMDGVTTIPTLRALNPQIKIIAVSGLISETQVAETMNLGIQAFLSKPFSSEQLLTSLREVLTA